MSASPVSTALRVRPWSESEFAQAKLAWDRLLAASSADPLFMCWDWQSRWWSHHRGYLGAELRVAAVYAADELVGIAPLYRRTVVVRRVFRMRRLEFIGIAWRDPRAVYSDYLDVIAARSREAEVVAALGAWLGADPDWDELALCCLRPGGPGAQLAKAAHRRLGHLREVDPIAGWRARLPASFEDYLAGLDGAVRRKLYHQRRKLADPEAREAEPTAVAESLDLLAGFVTARWGADPVREALQTAFHRDAAAEFARRGELRLSRLVVDEGPLSVLYAVRKADTVYYLQSAFSPGGPRGVSAGYLHFGYAIESACREGALYFDFLAGRGRHRDYKQDLLTERVPVVSYHVVRRRLARWAYTIYGWMNRDRARDCND